MAEGLTGEQWAEEVIAEHRWQSLDADPREYGWDVSPTMSDTTMFNMPVDGSKALAEEGFVVIPGRRVVNGVNCVANFIDRLGPDGEKTRFTLDAERALKPERELDTEREL